jgi:hypothetical protein
LPEANLLKIWQMAVRSVSAVRKVHLVQIPGHWIPATHTARKSGCSSADPCIIAGLSAPSAVSLGLWQASIADLSVLPAERPCDAGMRPCQSGHASADSHRPAIAACGPPEPAAFSLAGHRPGRTSEPGYIQPETAPRTQPSHASSNRDVDSGRTWRDGVTGTRG